MTPQLRLAEKLRNLLRRKAKPPEPPCECSWQMGMGPNLTCPRHWKRNQLSFGLTPRKP